MSLNRVVTVLLILALLCAGGAGGFWWWKDQPKQLLAAADQYYRQGETQLESNPAAAKQAFLKADEKLERLLDVKKDPRNSAAALRRYEVQTQLLKLYRKDDSNPDNQLLIEKARQEAQKYAQLAASDKKNVQAQILLLNLSFKSDELQDSLTFAENLLESNIEQDADAVKKYPTELAAAHFLKGRAALLADPPRPDEALNHVKACQEIKKKVAPSDEKLRWREIDLEARALQMKAKEAKARGPGAKGAKDDSQALLTAKIPEWIQRAQDEKKQIVVPAAGKAPDQALVVLLHPTNMRGLFSFLNLSIELAPTPEEVAERANLILDYCDALIAGRFLSPKALEYVNSQLVQLPTTLKKSVSEKFEKLPQETRDKLKQRIEKLTEQNKQAGAVMDPALYAQLAQDACDECRWDAAEALAFEGLHIAAARNFPAADPSVADLHESAARVLLLKKNLRTHISISLPPANASQPPNCI